MRSVEQRNALLKNTFIDYTQMSDFLENPLIFEKSEGLYVWDINGNRYFDAIGGVYVAVLGHRPPAVLEAVRKQMEKLTFSPPLHGISDVALDFIEKLGSVTPGNLNYVKGFSGGSESIEASVKFSRQYFKQTGHPGKYKVISNNLSYHGATFAAMAASGHGHYKKNFEPQMPGFVKAFNPIQLRDCYSTWEEANRVCINLAEKVIINENPDTIAAFIVEPICNTAGIVVPTVEYFKLLREMCSKYNILLIFDEILTGFGKTGDIFAAQAFGVTPDIICSGKGLSGGVIPIGSMIAKEEMGEVFFGALEDEIHFMHGHTFAGNPLACAVGIAVIDEIVNNGLHLKARVLGDHLEKRLEGLKKYGVVRETRGKGVLRGVEFVKDTQTMEPFEKGNKLGDALKKTSLKHGLILRVDPDWFAVSPPIISEISDIDEMCDRIERSLEDALNLVS
jgi:adenosylmethionine-8-amino-7-oxononanoate aminotransferase